MAVVSCLFIEECCTNDPHGVVKVCLSLSLPLLVVVSLSLLVLCFKSLLVLLLCFEGGMEVLTVA